MCSFLFWFAPLMIVFFLRFCFFYFILFIFTFFDCINFLYKTVLFAVVWYDFSVNICSTLRDMEHETLSSGEIRRIVQEAIATPRFTSLLPQGRQFLDETAKYFNDLAERMACLEFIESDAVAAAAGGGAGGAGAEGEDGAGAGAGRGKKSAALAAAAGKKAASSSSSSSSASSGQGEKEQMNHLRQRLLTMTSSQRAHWAEQALNRRSGAEFQEMQRLLRDNTLRLTAVQLHAILNAALAKYDRAQIQPGEAVGAIGAQSISEPGTQMTLKVRTTCCLLLAVWLHAAIFCFSCTASVLCFRVMFLLVVCLLV
jgi:hypothetical protein